MDTPPQDIALFRTASVDRRQARTLQRMAKAGHLVRVRRGVYADPAAAAGLDDRAQHVLRVRAVLPGLPGTGSLARLSAVAVQGWPHIGSWPARVHVTDAGSARVVHRDGVTIHRRTSASPPQPPPSWSSSFRFEGYPVDRPDWIGLDIARELPLHESVVVLDHLLRTKVVTPQLLRTGLGAVHGYGADRAGRAVELASDRRESVGESFAAVRLAELGTPPWEEQHEFIAADGTVDRVDFWSPDLGVVLEFDGKVKYEDPAMLGGRPPADVLWAEKRREDRIRARPEVRGFIRVRWWHLVETDRLRALLREQQVPCTR